MSEEEDRLESYVNDYTQDVGEGMTLEVINEEGGRIAGDDSETYERRSEWLNDTEGGVNSDTSSDVWPTLAKQEFPSSDPKDTFEIVYVEIPGWFIEKEDDLTRIFGNNNSSDELVGSFSVFRSETSEDSDGYAFKAFNINGVWREVDNMYSTVWVPESITTLYRKNGNCRPVDKESVYRRDALPDEVSRMEAEEDDYNWKLALGAAYRRCKGEETDHLTSAYENAQELPSKLYEKVEVGADEYMKKASANNKEVSDEDLAIVIESLTEALTPSRNN